MSRAHVAVACLLGSAVAAPAGAYVQWGPGVALLAAAVVLFLLGLLLGWEA